MTINLTKLKQLKVDSIDIDCVLDIESDDLDSEIILDDKIKFLGKACQKDGLFYLVGNITFSYKTNCYRCQKEISSSFNLEIDRQIKFANADLENEDDNLDFDLITVFDCNLDINKALVEDIILNLPARELCKEDCKGICFMCGKNLNETTCTCKVLDPRLSALDDWLLANDDE